MLTDDVRQTRALVGLHGWTAFVAPEVRCDVCRRRAHAWDLSAFRGPSSKLDRGTAQCRPDERAERRHHHAKTPVPVDRSNNANHGANPDESKKDGLAQHFMPLARKVAPMGRCCNVFEATHTRAQAFATAPHDSIGCQS